MCMGVLLECTSVRHFHASTGQKMASDSLEPRTTSRHVVLEIGLFLWKSSQCF